MSKSLIKVVDNSLFPAAVMVLGKFLGVLFVIRVFNLPWSIKEYTNNIFSFTVTQQPNDIALVTSYSDLVMFIFIAVGFSITIFRAIYLHTTHIKPTLVSKLANKNLLSLIQNSYEIYHSSFVWLLFTWIANVIIVVNSLAGRTYGWVAVVSVVSSMILTAILLQDVYKEVENIKHKPGEYIWK